MPETAAHVAKILGNISLPSCPAVLISIMTESRKEEPDFTIVSDLVSSDAAVSASVIKIVNSPAFRRSTNIVSIRQAVAVLGLKKVMLAVNAMFLRNSVSAAHPEAKAFLKNSGKNPATRPQLHRNWRSCCPVFRKTMLIPWGCFMTAAFRF